MWVWVKGGGGGVYINTIHVWCKIYNVSTVSNQ